MANVFDFIHVEYTWCEARIDGLDRRVSRLLSDVFCTFFYLFFSINFFMWIGN